MPARMSMNGSFDKTMAWLRRLSETDPLRAALERGGRDGVIALASATPYDTGLAASSWQYEIESSNGGYKIHWFNTDIENGANVVLLIQYGHGTGTGGYVAGRDFINPAIRPVMDKIIADVMKEVNTV